MPSDMQPGAAKRTRTIGPAHSRPMPLELAHESEIVDLQGYDGGAIKGKRVHRESAPSSGRVAPPTYYPNTKNFHNPNVDDDDSATEEDEDEDEQMVELSLKNPAKFSKAMATKRPTWKEPGGIDTPHSAKLNSRQSTDSLGSSGSVGTHAPAGATLASSTPILPLTPGPRAHLAELSDEARTTPPNWASTVTPESPAPETPTPTVTRVDMDLVFVKGTTKIMLTHQRPLIRNAFPDATVAFAFTRDALITATHNHGHGGAIVQRRLNVDGEYLTKLSRARFPLFCGEVKERCNAVSVAPIIATGSAAEISRLIRKQLSSYNYIFPGAPGNMGITGLVRTSHLYQNPQIITVIRDLYFTGGSTSFVSRFHHLFPTHQGEDGVVHQEVPMPMVTLVATALYATLYEWRGGVQQTTEFSANAYMDVYLANMNTLKHIQNYRECAFHVMMGDIYAQASAMGGTALTTMPIADLDLDDLE
ncbi:hypothetical protein H4582DRAFT_2080215 [Lactarius indigo]|nr:hypothetical protein H4582DRAFT_2080215 [Lactarius indigo]